MIGWIKQSQILMIDRGDKGWKSKSKVACNNMGVLPYYAYRDGITVGLISSLLSAEISLTKPNSSNNVKVMYLFIYS